MQCPVDNETLQMTERQGVEIDYCPRCRGVWLDRGELDKIIDRSDRDDDDDDDDDRRRGRPERRDDDDRYRYGEPGGQQYGPQYGQQPYGQQRYGQQPYGYRKKKKSLLSEMFDF